MLKAKNELKHFESEDDLFDSNDNEVILAWVNELADLKHQRRAYHKKRNIRMKMFAQVAEKMLAPDEVERVWAAAEEKMEEGE